MSNRIEGDRVVCHECQNEWDRAHGGLRCPRCESEFVEILEPGNTPDYDDPPEMIPTARDRSPMPRNHPLHDFDNHDPWARTPHDPDDGDITTIEFNNGLGRGQMTFSSRSYTFGGPGRPGMIRNDSGVPPEILANFNEMFSSIVGGPRQQGGPRVYGGTFQFGGGANRGMAFNTRGDPFSSPLGFPSGYVLRTPSGFLDHDNPSYGHTDVDDINAFDSLFGPAFGSPGQTGQNRDGFAAGPDPFALLSAIFNPAMGRSGDGVYTQEAFDRIMSDLMAQNQQNGAPPAAEELIKSLPRKKVDQKMLGSDGLAECSICMDNVEVGTEVATLPCSHWFHYECIESWLKEHDTCPHCRKPITPDGEQTRRPQSGRRRSSRRSSSIASPMPGPLPMEGIEETGRLPDSPAGLREARERYYGARRDSDMDRERPRDVRRTSTRSSSGRGESNAASGTNGGVLSTIRSRLPF